MPAEFLEFSGFHIALPVNDPVVLVGGNRPLGFLFNFWPEFSLDDWPREPVHAEAIIMQFAEKDIRADGSRLHAGEQVFCLRFNDDELANQIKRLLCGTALPSRFGRFPFVFNDGVESILPGAGRNARICSCQIRLGNLEIELWLPGGFVAGIEQSCGLGAILRTQAFLFASLGVFDVENPAKFAAVDDEATFHNSDSFVRSL